MSQPPPAGAPPVFVASETRLQSLIRSGQARARFLQGVFPFVGRGVFDLAPLNDALSYIIPPEKTAEAVYVRGGNLSDDLIYLTLSVNGTSIRYFPVGPKADFHVPLAIVESYPVGTRFDVCLAAPRGLSGTVVVDVGLVEVDEAE
jgi:assimilatory nitrate reductase catalytic subunit